MAFKQVSEIKQEKYAGKFVLENDQDTADVIFLYRNATEVVAADVHYIKSADYNGYVHCNDGGCPACLKGIRKQTKLFVPMYVVSVNGKPVNEIQFWDRTLKFEPQLQSDVFRNVGNPSEYVFRITRNGAHGDINTRYAIQLIANNKEIPYDKIMSDNNAKFPDYYEHICKDVDAVVLNAWLANTEGAATNTALPDYVATPRVSTNVASPEIPNTVELPSTEEITEEVDFG
jgi:hypothetical protein